MALVSALAAAVAIAGCGSSGDGDAVSKQEFTEQLKEVCSQGREERRALLKALAKEYYEERAVAPTESYQAKNLLKLMAIVHDTTVSIADIGLPEGEEKKVEDWIREREEATAQVEASPLGTRDNIQALFQKTTVASRDLGVGSCDL